MPQRIPSVQGLVPGNTQQTVPASMTVVTITRRITVASVMGALRKKQEMLLAGVGRAGSTEERVQLSL